MDFPLPMNRRQRFVDVELGDDKLMTKNLTFPKSTHIRSRLDFARVYEQGSRVSDAVLLLTAARNDEPQIRIGLSVSKRCGNAVHRNRWKRLIREAFRLTRAEMPCGLDLVVQPRAGTGTEPDALAVRRSLASLVKRVAKRLALTDNHQATAEQNIDQPLSSDRS